MRQTLGCRITLSVLLFYPLVSCMTAPSDNVNTNTTTNLDSLTASVECNLDRWVCTEVDITVNATSVRDPHHVTLGVLQHRARIQPPSLGTIILLPGGPGVDTRKFLRTHIATLPSDLVDNANLTVIESRSSALVDCKTLPSYNRIDVTPDTLSGFWHALNARLLTVEACRSRIGSDPKMVQAAAHADDLDKVRTHLGEEFVGIMAYSSGSLVSYEYRRKFPHRLAWLIVDGALNPTLSMANYLTAVAERLEETIERFVSHCVAEHLCTNPHEASVRILELIDGQETADGSARSAVAVIRSLYDPDRGWPTLMKILGLNTETAYQTLTVIGQSYLDDTAGVQLLRGTIQRCADGPFVSVEQLAELLDESEFSVLESYVVVDWIFCAGWLGSRDDHRSLDVEELGHDIPTLIIANELDTVIPVSWPEVVSEKLDSDVAYVRLEGHLAIGKHQCLNDLIMNFIEGKDVPTNNCHNAFIDSTVRS